MMMTEDQKPANQQVSTREGVAHEEQAVALDCQTRAKIGYLLRVMHDEVVKQDIPDRLADLLRSLDRQDKEPNE